MNVACKLCGVLVDVGVIADFRQMAWSEHKGLRTVKRCKVFALINMGLSMQRDPILLVLEAHECSNLSKQATRQEARPMDASTWHVDMTASDRDWVASVLESTLTETGPSPARERAVSQLVHALRSGTGADPHETTGARKAEAER